MHQSMQCGFRRPISFVPLLAPHVLSSPLRTLPPLRECVAIHVRVMRSNHAPVETRHARAEDHSPEPLLLHLRDT